MHLQRASNTIFVDDNTKTPLYVFVDTFVSLCNKSLYMFTKALDRGTKAIANICTIRSNISSIVQTYVSTMHKSL